MNCFPMFLCLTDRSVIIVGGSEQATQKCRLMLKTKARITIAWHSLNPELQNLVDSGRITWFRDQITSSVFRNAALVFIAIESREKADSLRKLAMEQCANVNVVDQPDLCTALTPAFVERGPVVVAIGTEGVAPVLAQKIKSQIETMLEPQLGKLAVIAGNLRARVARSVPPQDQRAFWSWVFEGSPREMAKRDQIEQARMRIIEAIAKGDAPAKSTKRSVCVLSVGSGEADLLPLRAMKRLQDADMIYYDQDVGPEILDIARRDALRKQLDKGQGHLERCIVAQASDGNNIVYVTTAKLRETMVLQDRLLALSGFVSEVELLLPALGGGVSSTLSNQSQSATHCRDSVATPKPANRTQLKSDLEMSL